MSRIHVRVTPRASRDVVTTIDMDGTIHLRVTAAPTDGQANAAVCKLLAKALDLPTRDVTIVAGATSRLKTIDVPLTIDEVRSRIQGT